VGGVSAFCPGGVPLAEKPQDTPLSIERTMIRKALEQAHRDKTLAAKLLGISQTELQRRMLVYGLTTDGLPEE
jgi:transcriptional regulator with PAS, ATPase and Fis domain